MSPSNPLKMQLGNKLNFMIGDFWRFLMMRFLLLFALSLAVSFTVLIYLLLEMCIGTLSFTICFIYFICCAADEGDEGEKSKQTFGFALNFIVEFISA